MAVYDYGEYISPKPVPTRIIRTPVSGPPPFNKLAFLACDMAGVDVPLGPDNNNDMIRGTVVFQTEFRIDDYQQSQYKWYQDNTLVSATCSLAGMDSTDEYSFVLSVDAVEWKLEQLDGSLTFKVRVGTQYDVESLFEQFSGSEMSMRVVLSAYVLCYEPTTDLPRSGTQRTAWAAALRDTHGIADYFARRERMKQSGAVKQNK